MLTPAMRAIFLLALPLLVPRVLADHEDPAVAADDLALLAHRLDRRSYLHDAFRSLESGRGGSGDRCGRRYHPPERVAARRWPAGLSATGEYSAVPRPLVSPTSTPDSAPACTLRRAGSPRRSRSPRRRRTPGGAARSRAAAGTVRPGSRSSRR